MSQENDWSHLPRQNTKPGHVWRLRIALCWVPITARDAGAVGAHHETFQPLRGSFSMLFEVYQFLQRRSADRTAVVRYTVLAIGAVQVTGFLRRRMARGSAGACGVLLWLQCKRACAACNDNNERGFFMQPIRNNSFFRCERRYEITLEGFQSLELPITERCS